MSDPASPVSDPAAPPGPASRPPAPAADAHAALNDPAHDPTRGGVFVTPGGQIVFALILWILSGATAAGALLLLRSFDFASDELAIIARYAAFGVSTILILLSVVFLLVGSIRWALFGARAPRHARLLGVDLRRDLELVHERLLLSETAKKVAYRREDVGLLHKTIRQDIADRDYNAAMVLVEALGGTYGQLKEAESFREEIRAARAAEQERAVEAGVLEMDRLLTRHDFAGARREAARLTRLYPDAPSVDGLGEWVDRAKAQHKRDLEEQFLHAKGRGEIDKAVELMHRLDKLLTPTEAEPFREAAREVFAKKRDNLGLQFKLAVHDKEWTTAVGVGEEIMREFPNSRMADEVRERIGLLRANAAQSGAMPPRPVSPPPPADAALAPSPPAPDSPPASSVPASAAASEPPA